MVVEFGPKPNYPSGSLSGATSEHFPLSLDIQPVDLSPEQMADLNAAMDRVSALAAQLGISVSGEPKYRLTNPLQRPLRSTLNSSGPK